MQPVFELRNGNKITQHYIMSWFSRKDKGILTPTESKREAPDGLWYQCPSCKKAMHTREHRLLAYTCSSCNYHEKIGCDVVFW